MLKLRTTKNFLVAFMFVATVYKEEIRLATVGR